MPETEVTRAFGVGVSSVKRYAAIAREGRSLAPKRRPGSRPKMNETDRRLLEANLGERPAATLPEKREFLERAARIRVSDSTISRLLKRLGFGRRKINSGSNGTQRVLEGGLEGARRRRDRCGALRVRGGGVRDEHRDVPPSRLVAQGRAGVRRGAAQLGRQRHAAREHGVRARAWDRAAMKGATTGAAFEAYVERALVPGLGSG